MLKVAKAISSGFKQTFDYRGRARRSEFWIWYAFTVVVGLAGFYSVSLLPWFTEPHGSYIWGLWSPVIPRIIGLLLCIPTWAFMNRRIRDTGLNPLWLWLNLLPLTLFVVAMFPLGLYINGRLLGANLFVCAAMAIVNIVFMCLPTKKD